MLANYLPDIPVISLGNHTARTKARATLTMIVISGRYNYLTSASWSTSDAVQWFILRYFIHNKHKCCAALVHIKRHRTSVHNKESNLDRHWM